MGEELGGQSHTDRQRGMRGRREDRQTERDERKEGGQTDREG